MIKAIIVEDSELARFELAYQLKKHPEIRLVGEAGDVDAAVASIRELAPDLVFLDIDLPGGDAFSVLAQLERIPQLIFTTAYEQHALAAFGFNTVDYLLKPIKPERLAQALEKLRPLPAREEILSPERPIFVKDGERCFLVKLKDVRYIEAIGNYSRLHTAGDSPLLYRSLNKLEERLDPAQFFRASRSHIVNLDYVEDIEPWSNGGLLLKLQGGGELEVSRRQSSLFRERLSL